MPPIRSAVHDMMLRRMGLVFLPKGGAQGPAEWVQLVEVGMASLGYALSTRLQDALGRQPGAEIAALQEWMWQVLAKHLGADQKHTPLFRKFPQDVPLDTLDLWWSKVLVYYVQAPDQPCLFCGRTGTTHVLNPCLHVVCDHCFDGSNYSACPACEQRVDRASPFFKPAPGRPANHHARLRRLDLGQDLEAQVPLLFQSFCERRQAMSPTDVDDLKLLVREYGDRVLGWLPAKIPVRENAAHVFGALMQTGDPLAVMGEARQFLATATDVLRCLAAYSGADPALVPELKTVKYVLSPRQNRWWGARAGVLAEWLRRWTEKTVYTQVKSVRFKVAPIRRPLRREILGFLDGLNPESLAEDMLRHRSQWVWLGEFLHPHEYARRFPNTARAFAVVRKKDPAGNRAPAFGGYGSKLEAALAAGDAAKVRHLLRQRPGEFARRFDHALRTAPTAADAQLLAGEFLAAMPSLATPVLLTLKALLPRRTKPLAVRVFWPKGKMAMGASREDKRPGLPADLLPGIVAAIEAELLRRFAAKGPIGDMIVDDALRDIVVPFNERTASRAAVALTRGSHLALPDGGALRLFVHWCEATAGCPSDLDLSVAFYDDSWEYVGVCSYYQLSLPENGDPVIARSSGDRRDAPPPEGASEFVDLHLDRARAAGIRYAAMVVNNYYGVPFEQLERAFAGVMLRKDLAAGEVFDPRTVELKFDLQGGNGVFLPLVVDVRDNRLHWLDVYAKGEFIFNNVATSNRDIRKLGPNLLDYFAAGVRPSMRELALLHGAARAERVILRGNRTEVHERRRDEEAAAFLARIRGGGPAVPTPAADQLRAPVMAALLRGDVDLPADADRYVLVPERLSGNMAASDLLS